MLKSSVVTADTSCYTSAARSSEHIVNDIFSELEEALNEPWCIDKATVRLLMQIRKRRIRFLYLWRAKESLCAGII
jgi:hypothetical protein